LSRRDAALIPARDSEPGSSEREKLPRVNPMSGCPSNRA
jgi:hypothetical protein